MQTLPKTIAEVLIALDHIIANAKADNDPTAYFAFLYRRVTAEIGDNLGKGFFEDDVRMEEFDVAFANRYLEAYHDHQEGLPVNKSWESAFQASDKRHLILQHLLLGVNAHINLDLGIAAAETMKAGQLQDLERDYQLVNDILERITDEVQSRLGRVSPLLFLADWLAGNADEFVINKTIRAARGIAWQLACQLEGLDQNTKNQVIQNTDQRVAVLAQAIKLPVNSGFRAVLRMIRFFEVQSVNKALEKLQVPVI
ncbi:MAG: DUF5995 family protein [Bacteroidota bacterium]